MNEWWCPVCDKGRKRVLPGPFRRNCGIRLCRPAKQGLRGDAIRPTIEAELQRRVDLDVTKRTMDEMRITLDRCFGGCKQFDGRDCTYRGSECRYRENWLLSVAAADCEIG